MNGDSNHLEFSVDDWRAASRPTPRIKRLANIPRRRFWARAAARSCGVGKPWPFGADAMVGEIGFHRELRSRQAAPGRSLRGLNVLVQGTGSGWDVIQWAQMSPKSICAVDLHSFEGWPEIARYCETRFDVPVEFVEGSLTSLSMFSAGSFDLAVSDAVLEHCVELEQVVAETRRLLRTGGRMYATYGPLWFSPGGDHYSGRGGLTHLYAHIEYSRDQYEEYFRRHLREIEDFQSGGRYVELDLFSRATTAEYLGCFERNGFEREWFVLEVSRDAQRFAKAFPERFQSLQNRYAGRVSELDLRIKANYVRLRSV